MLTAKSGPLYALAACLVLLCCAPCTLPAAAQGDATNPSRTLLFLQAFIAKVPVLANAWTGTDYCKWDGITCDNAAAGTGVRISLSGRSLSGVMPDVPKGNGDVSVVAIDLSNNPQLSGGFKDSWSALMLLEELDLSSTALFGSIPDSWNAMHFLRKVRISNTGACRSLPNWSFDSMPLLEEVDFSNNALRILSEPFGTFSNSTKLISLNLRGNSFCFCLPATWMSTVLQDAARSATPAVMDLNCGINNKCMNGEAQRCDGKNGAALPMFYTTVMVMLLTCFIAL